MSADAALLREIELLSGAIAQHKSGTTLPPVGSRSGYAPANGASKIAASRQREVVINGAAYEASRRKLTRKDVATHTRKTAHMPLPLAPTHGTHKTIAYHAGHTHRAPIKGVYKPKSAAPYKRLPYGNRNKVLNNVVNSRTTGKALKPTKQCRYFSISGVCTKGRTCPYLHDPAKVAICPRFLQRECPLDASSCPLSHEPTPERVPLCVHFANNGRCKNGDTCLYPHVHVGKRLGVCRDFAVLGYCDRGIDCDKQHIRECPDFAEKGACHNRTCKLPHVIRANRTRPEAAVGSAKAPRALTVLHADVPAAQQESMSVRLSGSGEEEFIPLTFVESSDDEDESSDEDASNRGTDEGEQAMLVDDTAV